MIAFASHSSGSEVQKVGDKEVAASPGYNLQNKVLCNCKKAELGAIKSKTV
jgi:hypothetical protein